MHYLGAGPNILIFMLQCSSFCLPQHKASICPVVMPQIFDHVPLLNHSSRFSGYCSYLEAVPFIGALACLSMGNNHLCDWGEGKSSRKKVAPTAVGFHSLIRNEAEVLDLTVRRDSQHQVGLTKGLTFLGASTWSILGERSWQCPGEARALNGNPEALATPSVTVVPK